MKKTVSFALFILLTAALLIGCGSDSSKETPSSASSEPQSNTAANETAPAMTEEPEAAKESETEIQVFVAASLNTVMQKIIEEFNKVRPDVKVIINADSSGKLLTQIEEGYECDIFFSAAQKQMDQLEKDGLVISGSRKNVLNNQLVVVTRKDSKTKVTGLENLEEAGSIALAGGSVPAGKYTRQALVKLGILKEAEDVSSITTREVSEALKGVEISEQDNVSKVLMAVVEGSCEVGTTYLSDTYGYEDQLRILQTVDDSLTGDIIYPVCRVTNQEADEKQTTAAVDFYDFILSDIVKTILDSYYFDTKISE